MQLLPLLIRPDRGFLSAHVTIVPMVAFKAAFRYLVFSYRSAIRVWTVWFPGPEGVVASDESY